MDNDELGLSVSIKNEEDEEDLEESVRLQGKNGVLMENKHKQVGLSHIGNSQNLDGKRLSLSHNIHGQHESRKKRTVMQSKSNAPKSNKESKIKRPNFTEKQLLREKIKTMLLGAGWTIDYRPRRTRDYLDSVYISPSGTAYWSITKAYDALKKEEKEKEKENTVAKGDFTPLPNEILNKLTRQTQKKIERELEKSRRHEDNIRKPKRVKKSTQFRSIDQNKEKLDCYLKEASEDSSGYSSDDSPHKETPQKDGVHAHTNPHNLHESKSRMIGRRTLVVRGSEKGLDSEKNDFIPYSGKRNLISWLIDSGMVSVGEKVEYKNLRRTRVMQEGWITEDGIHCGCCSKLVTVLRFELHAGSKLGQPLKNIFIQSGRSLMECQIDGWNKQKESERKGFHVVDVEGDDPDDDTCGLCGDGGDLICCDGCPSTFHLSCLDMQMLPEGDWHCPNCACKYCNKDSGRTGSSSSLLTCRLCEKKYHKSCSGEMDMFCFCGRKCQELYTRLQKLLWMKHELDSGFSWSLIHRSDLLPDMSSLYFYQRAECISKIAIALLVMDECFLPIVDRRSGINLIHNVVYNCGSNISRLNYSGFFTAILERGDEMICAASIRIHGTQLAEMPFIGTRDIYRRQGMCRRLLHAIESALTSLKVEKLVIPAIEEHMDTWTNAFGFKPLEESCKQEMKSFNMMVFPGTDMLQKQLIKKRTLETNMTSKKDSIPSKNILRTKRPVSFFNGGVGKKGVEVEDYNKGKKSELNNTSIRNGDSEPDSNVVKRGNKTGSRVERTDLRNSNETAPGITDSDSNVIICEPQLQVTEKDSVSNSVVLRNGNVTDTPLESDLQFLGKESGSVSMAKENDVKDGRDATNGNV
ncbi:uncharacterized protein LOC111889083 isoform X1 [Lactuca sativa]|uniref:uncharacterized protein LOC111889083 isoform X1 n=1 Tax=Lactuca sativa TaxID=4236 RepID=UPI000CC11851|nr:uncharacterized protein LOC111889083 isoform X1 [Lactuca sativa]